MTAELEGRAPAPEACLDNTDSVDVFRVPPGTHRFTVRDAATDATDAVRVSVVAPAPGEFVPSREWRRVVGDSVPAGLDVRLPLDGADKEARIPKRWRLQLYPRPRRALPSFPRNIHVAAEAPPRPVSTEYSRRSRGGVESRAHTSQ